MDTHRTVSTALADRVARAAPSVVAIHTGERRVKRDTVAAGRRGRVGTNAAGGRSVAVSVVRGGRRDRCDARRARPRTNVAMLKLGTALPGSTLPPPANAPRVRVPGAARRRRCGRRADGTLGDGPRRWGFLAQHGWRSHRCTDPPGHVTRCG